MLRAVGQGGLLRRARRGRVRLPVNRAGTSAAAARPAAADADDRTVAGQGIVTSETDLIWTEFGDRLRRFVARRVANEADAEDILQEVFLRVHRRIGTLARADRLTSWLFQITRNAIVDHYRAAERRRALTPTVARPREDGPRTDALVEGFEEEVAGVREELASCLRPMVERLPPRYRDAIVLVEMEGLTHHRAAARLGLSVSGTKSRVQRGRLALKEMLVACCRVRHDAGGRVTDYELRGASCGSCDARRDEEGRSAGCSSSRPRLSKRI